MCLVAFFSRSERNYSFRETQILESMGSFLWLEAMVMKQDWEILERSLISRATVGRAFPQTGFAIVEKPGRGLSDESPIFFIDVLHEKVRRSRSGSNFTLLEYYGTLLHRSLRIIENSCESLNPSKRKCFNFGNWNIVVMFFM